LKLNCKQIPDKLFFRIAEDMTLATAIYDLITRPGDLLVRRWNWKAAFTSSLIRALIFFFTNITAGWRAAAGAMLAEWAYRAISSGFYGAMTHQFSLVEPEWQAAVGAGVILPLCSHSIEFTLHYFRHTPHLKASIIASVSFTVISTLFNFYAMRRGTMVVGERSPSLAEDFRVMPRIIFGFVAVVPLWAWRSLWNRTA
jgi:hypothetical protein